MYEIWHRVNISGETAHIELGEGGTIPDGICEWLLGRNGVLVEACQGLTDGELIKSFSTSDIFKNYRFREEAMRRTTPVALDTHTESYLDEQSFSGGFQII